MDARQKTTHGTNVAAKTHDERTTGGGANKTFCERVGNLCFQSCGGIADIATAECLKCIKHEKATFDHEGERRGGETTCVAQVDWGNASKEEEINVVGERAVWVHRDFRFPCCSQNAD